MNRLILHPLAHSITTSRLRFSHSTDPQFMVAGTMTYRFIFAILGEVTEV